MHIEALIQLFSLKEPWAFGRRDAVSESSETIAQASLEEYPYFAVRGIQGSQFRVVGEELDECVENLLLGHPTAEIVSCEPAGSVVLQGDPPQGSLLAEHAALPTTAVEGKD